MQPVSGTLLLCMLILSGCAAHLAPQPKQQFSAVAKPLPVPLEALLKWPGPDAPSCNLVYTDRPAGHLSRMGPPSILSGISVSADLVRSGIAKTLEVAANIPHIQVEGVSYIRRLRSGDCIAELLSSPVIGDDVAIIESVLVDTQIRFYIFGWNGDRWIPWAVASGPVI